MPAGAWTWLEVAKLLASLSIPVALLLLGLALERRKVANQRKYNFLDITSYLDWRGLRGAACV